MHFGEKEPGPVSKIGTNLEKRDKGYCGQGRLGVGEKVRADADGAGGGHTVCISQGLKARERGLDFITNQTNVA